MLKPTITFVIRERGRTPRRETIRRGVIRIGSDPKGHLHLNDPAVAKRHAVIEIAGPERVTLVVLAGESGVRLNGESIDESLLGEGDRIELGDSELLVEEIAFDAAETAAPMPARVALIEDADDAEPALAFATAAMPIASFATVAAASYALLQRGPTLRPDEVEVPHLVVAEVQVCWGDNVLFVTHLDPSETFHVGEEARPDAPCGFLVPREKLGCTRLALVIGDAERLWLVIPPQATGHIEGIDGSRTSLAVARLHAEPCSELPGARKLALSLGVRARLEFGDIIFNVAAVRAGKPMPHGLVAGWDASVLAYLGLSALSVGGLLSSMAFLVPPLGLSSDEETGEDRLYLLQQYLSSAAEREKMRTVGDALSEAPESPAAGAAASGDEGGMGKPNEERTEGRYAIKGSADRNQQQLSRHAAAPESERFEGIIGLLNSELMGDPDAPTAPWGADHAVGSDAVSAQGLMWSSEIGNARGPGGLGLTGPGEGGGRHHEGIGVGDIGTIGSLGLDDEGMGLHRGRPTGTHRTSAPRLRSGDTHISGRLPAEIVRRIVRQNHPRFRHCYEKGLFRNPSLEGRVSVRFVIGRDGAVTHVSDAGSDLPDPTVVRCVTNAFYDVGFPKPEGGIVTVTYPIMLQPD